MPGFNPFDMDMDGDVAGIDFLGFDYLVRHVLSSDEPEDDHEDSEIDEDDHEDLGIDEDDHEGSGIDEDDYEDTEIDEDD